MYPNSRTAGAWLAVAVAMTGSTVVLLDGHPAAAAPPNQQCTTPSNDLLHDTPWTVRRLDPQRVWNLTNGRGTVVAVVDTGVDGQIPQLAGHVLPGVDVVNGGGRADTDCAGHGTFVAGIIAAQPLDGTGVVGVAPGVTILPVRQANSASDGTSDGLARSIRVAVDSGARVVNISASAFFPSDALRTAVDYATAHDVLLVASASNEAQAGNPKAYPAAYPQVIAVGAIGQDGQRSEFSEVGNYLDLVAPGVDIVSLSRGGKGHLTDNGTSYATPFVTAVAALVRSYFPHLTAAQVKRRLELTADHPGTALPNPQMGWGVVNPYNAITTVLPQETGTAGVVAAPGPPGPIRLVNADTHVRNLAVTFGVALVLFAVIVSLLAYVLPRGARRGWQPVDLPGPATRAPGERPERAGRYAERDRDPRRDTDSYLNPAGHR